MRIRNMYDVNYKITEDPKPSEIPSHYMFADGQNDLADVCEQLDDWSDAELADQMLDVWPECLELGDRDRWVRRFETFRSTLFDAIRWGLWGPDGE